jgi:hypothetical protein
MRAVALLHFSTDRYSCGQRVTLRSEIIEAPPLRGRHHWVLQAIRCIPGKANIFW